MIDNSINNDYDEVFEYQVNYANLEDEYFDYLNNQTEDYPQNSQEEYFDFNDLGNPDEAHPQNIEEEEYSYMDMNQEDSDDGYERHLAELAIEEQAITNTNNLPAPNTENLHSSKPLHSTREV